MPLDPAQRHQIEQDALTAAWEAERVDFPSVEQAYERTSVMIITNLGFSEWATAFCDAKLTNALSDWFDHDPGESSHIPAFSNLCSCSVKANASSRNQKTKCYQIDRTRPKQSGFCLSKTHQRHINV